MFIHDVFPRGLVVLQLVGIIKTAPADWNGPTKFDVVCKTSCRNSVCNKYVGDPTAMCIQDKGSCEIIWHTADGKGNIFRLDCKHGSKLMSTPYEKWLRKCRQGPAMVQGFNACEDFNMNSML